MKRRTFFKVFMGLIATAAGIKPLAPKIDKYTHETYPLKTIITQEAWEDGFGLAQLKPEGGTIKYDG